MSLAHPHEPQRQARGGGYEVEHDLPLRHRPEAAVRRLIAAPSEQGGQDHERDEGDGQPDRQEGVLGPVRPSDGDGYAFRGFTYLVKHNYQQARNDFELALGEGSPSGDCTAGSAPTPNASQRASLVPVVSPRFAGAAWALRF